MFLLALIVFSVSISLGCSLLCIYEIRRQVADELQRRRMMAERRRRQMRPVPRAVAVRDRSSP